MIVKGRTKNLLSIISCTDASYATYKAKNYFIENENTWICKANSPSYIRQTGIRFNGLEIGKTYTFSFITKEYRLNVYNLFFSTTPSPDLADYGSINMSPVGFHKITFTARTEYLYVKKYLTYAADSRDLYFILTNIQLEEGTEATEYENPTKSYLTADSDKLMEEMN